ncbi:MAG: restriction endonuclease [Fimbriimonadaceae bacterium]|nr:restriction endonuclease [Fimbriimonadaceae bacterium]
MRANQNTADAEIFGAGPLGFGTPRLCVRVNSENAPIDRPAVDKLPGAVSKFGAQEGLFDSWSGFKANGQKELAASYLRVRTVDSEGSARTFVRAPRERGRRPQSCINAQAHLDYSDARRCVFGSMCFVASESPMTEPRSPLQGRAALLRPCRCQSRHSPRCILPMGAR